MRKTSLQTTAMALSVEDGRCADPIGSFGASYRACFGVVVVRPQPKSLDFYNEGSVFMNTSKLMRTG